MSTATVSLAEIIPHNGSSPDELLASAHEREQAVAHSITEGTSNGSGWQEVTRLHLTQHYAAVGLEDEAREVLAEMKARDLDFAFTAQMSILDAFQRPTDADAARELAGDTSNKIYHARNKLRIVKHDVAHGDTDHLPRYIDTIPLLAEKALAQIAFVGTLEGAENVRKLYVCKPIAKDTPQWKSPDVWDDVNGESDARIDLAIASKDTSGKYHKAALKSLKPLVRPDSIRDDIFGYMDVLLEQGRHREVESLIKAIARPGHYNVEEARVRIAQNTRKKVDVSKAKSAVSTIKHPGTYVQAGYMADLVGVYVDNGELETARDVTKTLFETSSLHETIEYHASEANIHLIRGFLAVGETDLAEVSYRRAMREKHPSIFVAANLAIARYLRTGQTDQAA